MQRPFVLLVTDDPDFERVAIDAILATRHGVRRAHSLDEAHLKLRESAPDLALAVVDTTRPQFGGEVLRALADANANFAVLAITDAESDAVVLDEFPGLALARLEKSAPFAELCRTIGKRCTEALALS
jgi:DNA-binding NarL/FixJ family response regulator